MEHSPKYEMVKHYYSTFNNGKRIWDESKLRNLVAVGVITEAEFTEITGLEQ